MGTKKRREKSLRSMLQEAVGKVSTWVTGGILERLSGSKVSWQRLFVFPFFERDRCLRRAMAWEKEAFSHPESYEEYSSSGPGGQSPRRQ